MNFKIYDILGHIIPGALILLVLVYFRVNSEYVFNINLENYIEKLKLASLIPVLFLIISYTIGYLISGLSSWSEKVLWLLWGGRPSKILLTKEQCYFGLKLNIKRIRLSDNEETCMKLITPLLNDSNFSISKLDANEISSLFQKIKYKAIYESTEFQQKRLQDFYDSYLFSRNLLVSIFIIFISLIYYMFSCCLVLMFLFFVLLLLRRSYDRALYYSKELFETALSNM